MFWKGIALHPMSLSQGQAAIRPIPKSSNSWDASEFWQISLFNSGYIIMSSILARRLRKPLPATIGPHQKGGVPGRLISDNLFLFRDVIQHFDDDVMISTLQLRGY
jgi:hypothetical protein